MYTWKRNYVIIAEIKTVKKKKISKKEFIANSYITLSFLYIWNLKDERIDTQPWFLRKPYLITDQNGQNLFSFSDQNGAKSLPFRAAHTYLAYKRKYSPPPGSKMLQSVVIQFLSSYFYVLG